MKISFDFDNTLSIGLIYRFTSTLVGKHELFILSSRRDITHPSWKGNEKEYYELFNIAADLSIPNENIYLTNRESKIPKLKEWDIDLHIDDDEEVCNEIKDSKIKCSSFKFTN